MNPIISGLIIIIFEIYNYEPYNNNIYCVRFENLRRRWDSSLTDSTMNPKYINNVASFGAL